MARTKLTPEQRKELEALRWELIQMRATGARQVTHGDKTVVLKSESEIKEAIDNIDRMLSGERKTRIIKVYAKRGV